MRTIASTFRANIEASNTSDFPVIFVTVSHPNLDTPLYFNSDIRNYLLNGITYIGAALEISLLSDDVNPPQAKVTIPNVDEEIGDVVLAMTTPPRIEMDVYAASDFDSGSPANPLSGNILMEDGVSTILMEDGVSTFQLENPQPVLQYSAPYLFLQNVQCDAVSLSADIRSFDLSSEPWPSIRSTRDRLPGLFR